jgi:putative tryptophan/tyrosine transport system substrate-binding protein
MKRRGFIGLLGGTAAWALEAWALAAWAQQRDRVRHIGFLGPERRLKKMHQGLGDLGYVEGQDIIVEYRPSDRPDRLPGFAAELVALKVDVIVASGSLAVRAAQQATRSIPIVMTGSSDPVGAGFVSSLAHPGGNITGMSLQNPELSGKRLELLTEIVAGLSLVGVLSNPDDPPVVFSLRETKDAAQALSIELQFVEARKPEDFEGAFASLTRRQPGALVILPASIMTRNAERIAELALKSKLPAISYFKEFPEAGGLISYGPNLDDSCRHAAVYVDKILKGTSPADLPVQQPTKFELVVNLKTAKAIDLAVPASIVAHADEVIE